MTNETVSEKPAKPDMKKKNPPKPVCVACLNVERFEIDESDWDIDREGNQVLIEKVKCLVCGVFLKATYKLVEWEAWEDE